VNHSFIKVLGDADTAHQTEQKTEYWFHNIVFVLFQF